MGFPYYSQDYYSDSLYVMIGFLFVIFIAALLFGFIYYLFNAMGLYKLAKNRGYQYAWLAYIPIASTYILGSIADNINKCYQKKSNLRVWLLVLAIVQSFGSIIYSVVTLASFPEMISDSYYGVSSSIASTLLISSLVSLSSIGFLVIRCICEYKVYTDYAPKNATMLLVLSILLGLSPFFIFAIRNKPSSSIYYAQQQTQQPQYQPQQQQYQPQQQQYQPQQQQYQPQQPQYQPQQQQYQPQQQQYQPQQQQYQPQQQQPVSPVVTKTTTNNNDIKNDSTPL